MKTGSLCMVVLLIRIFLLLVSSVSGFRPSSFLASRNPRRTPRREIERGFFVSNRRFSRGEGQLPAWLHHSCGSSSSTTALFINFNWFSNKKDQETSGSPSRSSDTAGVGDNLAATGTEGSSGARASSGGAASTAGMGGVAATMEIMENFQTSQRAGKITRKLVQDLASTTVEGVAADGKVKVVLDISQRPVSVDIDEGYLETVDAAELCSAIASAMSDAHAKSIDRMDEKMKGLYSELGLPSSV